MRSFGHLSSTPARPSRFERADDGDADRQRQAGEEAGALLEAPAEREREAAAGDGGPGAAAAAAAGRLPLGREQRAVDVAALRAAQQLARRRVDLVDDLDGDRRRARNDRRADGGSAMSSSLAAGSAGRASGCATSTPNPSSADRTAAASRKSGVASRR